MFSMRFYVDCSKYIPEIFEKWRATGLQNDALMEKIILDEVFNADTSVYGSYYGYIFSENGHARWGESNSSLDRLYEANSYKRLATDLAYKDPSCEMIKECTTITDINITSGSLTDLEHLAFDCMVTYDFEKLFLMLGIDIGEYLS